MAISLEGYEIFVNTGQPVVGATVTAHVASASTPNPNAATASTVTDANGKWAFAGLADGKWDIRVVYSGNTKEYKGNSRPSYTHELGNFGTQAANLVLAGPASGAAANPTFRAAVAADLPGVQPTTWTPVVTQGAATPTFTHTSRYLQIGKLIRVRSKITFTAAGAAGVVIVTGFPVNNNDPDGQVPIGEFVYLNAASFYTGVTVMDAAAQAKFFFSQDTGVSNYWGLVPALAIAIGDVLAFTAIYEAV